MSLGSFGVRLGVGGFIRGHLTHCRNALGPLGSLGLSVHSGGSLGSFGVG